MPTNNDFYVLATNVVTSRFYEKIKTLNELVEIYFKEVEKI